MLEVNKKVLFFRHRAIENFDHCSHPVFAEKDFGPFLACKKVFDYDNLLYGSIRIEFHHSVFIPVVERLFSPKVNEVDNGYNDQIW